MFPLRSALTNVSTDLARRAVNEVIEHGPDMYAQASGAVTREFRPAGNIKDSYRSLKIMIVNNTDFELEYGHRDHFDSGVFYQHPTPSIMPHDIAEFIVCNAPGSVLQGVTGAVQYRVMPKLANYNNYVSLGTKQYLHIGFCNPAMGAYKYFVGLSTDQPPKYGYDQCVNANEQEPMLFIDAGFKLTACSLDGGNIVQKVMQFTIDAASESRGNRIRVKSQIPADADEGDA